MDATLLLNADGSPISLLPLSSLSWQDAVSFVWRGTAEPLHHYEDWTVRSPSTHYEVPSVAILKRHVSVEKRVSSVGGPSAFFVFLRDDFTCQYCFESFPRSKLTLDHVLPRFHGGQSGWDNLATACEPCNGRRGHDMRIQPRVHPVRPSHGHLVRNLRKQTLLVPHLSWNLYLGWPEEKVRLVAPRKT